MGNDVAGTIKKVTLDGQTFDVMADSNMTETGGPYENDRIPVNRYRSIRKMTTRVEKREGLMIACNAEERKRLRELSMRETDFPMSYVTADGSTYRARGTIEFENRETEETRAAIQLHPNGEWEEFIAA
jgi:hypothetical protein